jgi:2-polyprenyl-6-methoxyphenol hydroxylase-like FAD-dependent oxidoreductase
MRHRHQDAQPMPASVGSSVIVVGAGPTGLAAGLFLSRRGVPVRIIDAAAQPTSTSRALLVNSRSLEILEEGGVAARIKAEGYEVTAATMHRGKRAVATIDLHSRLSRQLPIGLGQARTEALLHEALQTQGVEVERGIALVSLQQDADQVTLSLQSSDGGMQTASAPVVFGADGARSTVRHSLGLGFAGHSLPEPWMLWDLRMDTPLDPQHAHLCLTPDGFLFVMCLRPGVWRVLGNGADPLAELPAGCVPGEVLWQSQFHIAHRLADTVHVGRVALGGDAAHIHSPLGARGMNLGIEDAWVFADCAADAFAGKLDRLREYARLREPIHRQLVHRIAAITRVMHGTSEPLRSLRNVLVPRMAGLSFVQKRLVQTVTGLDHPLRTRL